MIQINSLRKEFAGEVLFDELSMNVSSKERIGIVGRNGSGKSTLLKIILNEESADSGTVSIPNNYKLGSLRQSIEITQDTVIDEVALELSDDKKYLAKRILMGVGFSEVEFNSNPNLLSGGYQLRLSLAKTLLSAPDMLLLDEPTNYLDIVGLRWLKNYIISFQGEVLLITHDREFMDSVVTSIAGVHRKKLRKISGRTDDYYTQIEQDELIYERTRQNKNKQRKEMETFVNKFRAKARQASLAQSRLKMLQKMEVSDKLGGTRELSFSFNFQEFEPKKMASVNNLSFQYEADSPTLISDLCFEIEKGDRIAVIGKNGKGKSTLLNLLADELTPSSGEISKHPSAVHAHFGQTNISRLIDSSIVEKEIERANPSLSYSIVKSICGAVMFPGKSSEKEIRILSGGEKSRVMLGQVLASKVNLLLLDEPTNHLDQESVEGLIDGVDRFPGAVVFVTHSENIIRKLSNKLIVFHRDRVEFFRGEYDYFLEKIGWEEEESESPSKNKSKVSRKEIRRMRSEIISEKSQKLNPLKKTIDDLEEQISYLEKVIIELQESLVVASQSGKSQDIELSSREISRQQTKVDDLFEQLEEKYPEYERLLEEFDKRLNKCDSLSES